ncbi:MAG: hypothetical protein ACD_15C00137G0018 [uncultured bacterium]|nr:MAG: hypothetical protein ACD_15C00137G0018 [uncultured bacterium]
MYGKTPMPSWVKNGGNHNMNEFEGVGVAHKSRKGMQDQIDAAYDAAVEQMSRSIESLVETSITRREEYLDGQLRSEEVEQKSRHYTNVLLRGISKKAQWIEDDSCTLWILVAADKAKIERMFAKHLLDNAEDYYNSALQSDNDGEKVDKLNLAIKTIKLVNFDILTSGLSQNGFDFYSSRYISVRDKAINNIMANSNHIYDSSWQNLNRAKSSMNDLRESEAMSLLEEVDRNISRLLELEKYYPRDLGNLKEEMKKTKQICVERVRFLGSLRIGMSVDEVHALHGEPNLKTKERVFFFPSKAFYYDPYWLIFKSNNKLDCVKRYATVFDESKFYDCEDRRK